MLQAKRRKAVEGKLTGLQFLVLDLREKTLIVQIKLH